MHSHGSRNNKPMSWSRSGAIAAAAALGAAATAAWVESRARQAERDHPPTGKFIDIDGVRLHYVERGEGPPVVLLHGNTVTHADFIASGLMDRLAARHRVIAFDRPGFGHSSRPRDRLWTPSAQAKVLRAALERLGVERPVVVGHSMGAMVALAMALNHPAHVRSLVLVGGYFHPSFRIDALLTAPVALPVLGDVMRYTVTPLAGRLMLGKLVRALFAPREVPAGYIDAISREMMLRPVQLRANAEDGAFMVPAAQALSKRYGELTLPITFIDGEDDGVLDPQAQAARLHQALPHSELHLIPGVGHMAHHAALDAVVNAIDRPLHAVALQDLTPMTQADLTLEPQPQGSAPEPELGRR